MPSCANLEELMLNEKDYGVLLFQKLQQNLPLQVVVLTGVASIAPLSGGPLAPGWEYS